MRAKPTRKLTLTLISTTWMTPATMADAGDVLKVREEVANVIVVAQLQPRVVIFLVWVRSILFKTVDTMDRGATRLCGTTRTM